MDAGLQPGLLGGAHLVGVLAAVQHRAGGGAVQPGGLGGALQHVVRFDHLGTAVVGGQQLALQGALLRLALQPGPVQQAMAVEGVVDAAAPFRVEGEAGLGAALADGVADLRLLLGRGAVLGGQVLAHVLPARRHLRVELEWLQVHAGLHGIGAARQRLLQRRKAHCAPGTGDVGNEVDAQGLGAHGRCSC